MASNVVKQLASSMILAIPRSLQVAAGNTIYEGRLVGLSSGKAIVADNAHPVLGVAITSKAGGYIVTANFSHVIEMSLPGVVSTDWGSTVYAADDVTLTLTPNVAVIGQIIGINTATERVQVHMTLGGLNGAGLVDSVFGRTGTVVAAASDYDASQIDNDSVVTGTFVDDALKQLHNAETYLSKAVNYTAVAGDNAIGVDTSGGARTITLPAASLNPGVRIRVSKITNDVNQVIVATTGLDEIGFQSQWTLSVQGDSLTALSDGSSNWILFTERHASDHKFFKIDPNANLGSHRVRSIAATGNVNMEFRIPDNFLSLISLTLEANPAVGAAGSGRDIDLISDYGGLDEPYNAHSETDTTTVYDFTGKTDTFVDIDLSGAFSNISAGDRCGINVDHNAVGGAIRYTGITLVYLKKG